MMTVEEDSAVRMLIQPVSAVNDNSVIRRRCRTAIDLDRARSHFSFFIESSSFCHPREIIMPAYRLFGFEMSPYSVKVRSLLRYKQLPHEWIVRRLDRMGEFQQYARLPLVPLLVDENGQGRQDSTPIIEWLDQQHPAPSIYSGDVALDFIACVLEEFADEWLNKPMFHFRWHYSDDADSAALRIVREMLPPDAAETAAQGMVAGVRERMCGRLGLVGSNARTAALIERSFQECSQALDVHLASRDFLFGGRPLLADFGVYGQYWELLSDPTPGRWLRENCPHLCAFVQRMDDPRAHGALESLATLQSTLLPVLRLVARWFVPWTQANATALAQDAETFTLTLAGEPFSQQPQKYHARSWAELKRKYAACAERTVLDPLLQQTGLLAALNADA